jgi:hypothetical protein
MAPPRPAAAHGSASYGVNLVGVARRQYARHLWPGGQRPALRRFRLWQRALDADYAINGGAQTDRLCSIAADGKGFSGKFDTGIAAGRQAPGRAGSSGRMPPKSVRPAVHNENNLVAFALTGARDGQDAAGTITAPLGRGLTMTRDSTTGAVRVSQSSRIVPRSRPMAVIPCSCAAMARSNVLRRRRRGCPTPSLPMCPVRPSRASG